MLRLRPICGLAPTSSAVRIDIDIHVYIHPYKHIYLCAYIYTDVQIYVYASACRSFLNSSQAFIYLLIVIHIGNIVPGIEVTETDGADMNQYPFDHRKNIIAS